MGTSRWNYTAYVSHSTSRGRMTREEIFVESRMHSDMDPKGVTFREARDSALNPNSTPIIIALDQTGSMGRIAHYMATDGLGKMVEEILSRKPVTDPAVMIMAVGDAICREEAPLQVGQFESDIAMNQWLEKIYLEGGGGGNDSESYDLPHYFAAYHTKTDAFEKRGEKGILVTIGDEMPRTSIRADIVKKYIGDDISMDMSFEDILDASSIMYKPYHIIVAEGYYARRHLDEVRNAWQDYLGQRAIVLTDHTKIAELIVSILEIESGRDVDEVIASWGEDIAAVIGSSYGRLPRRIDADPRR